jgi:hypothetical protein
MCAGAGAAAQSTTGAGQAQSPTQPGTTTQADRPATTQQASTTITGCVYREADVPGRAPNVAERAGILEDYILAEADSSSPQTAATPSAGATAGTVGTSGSAGKMYKLELIADDQLRAVVGKRVEVTGRIDAEPGDAPAGATGTTGATSQTDRVLGRDRIALPEFEVTSIKEVAGACSPAPGATR